MVEVVGGAVELVGAGLDGEVCGAAGVAAELGCAGGDEGEVFNGVDGEDDAGDGGDAALIDGGNVPPEIVVVSAFNLPVDGVGTASVDAGDACAATCGEAGESGGLSEHLSEVAAAVGQILHDDFRQDGGLQSLVVSSVRAAAVTSTVSVEEEISIFAGRT